MDPSAAQEYLERSIQTPNPFFPRSQNIMASWALFLFLNDLEWDCRNSTPRFQLDHP